MPRAKKNAAAPVDRVRRIALAIPGAIEKLSHGSPTFFTPKRVFAIFVDNHYADGHIAAWLPAAPGMQKLLIEEAPDTYFRPPYVGPAGWIGVELSKVDDAQLTDLIQGAYRFIQAKSKRRC